MEYNVLRAPAERLYANELEALSLSDKAEKPQGWRLSPGAVLTFIMGGTANGAEITPKYIGDRRLVEICVATLMTDRALLLLGEPGTAKSRVSECLAAAISGDSSKIIQGTAGTGEEQIKYGWNYAMLISGGPSRQAMTKSPVTRAMESGSVVRVEELTRCPGEVQDALISILSEHAVSVPELGEIIEARRGFSLIATANTGDRGVFAMSSALQRRFNAVVLPSPPSLEAELSIVSGRVRELSGRLGISKGMPDAAALERLVRIFRELRSGETTDGAQKLTALKSGVSAADAISAGVECAALSYAFGGDGPERLAASLTGALARSEDGVNTPQAFLEYQENIMKNRGPEWNALYRACRDLNR